LWSARLQIDRGRLPVLSDLRLKLDLLTLGKSGQPRSLDSGDVHEYVGAAVSGRDEAVALLVVEVNSIEYCRLRLLLDGNFFG
jgi:hypothetical protein